MNFKIEPQLKPLDLERVDNPGGRVYRTPSGNLPSITTVLSRLSREDIKKWRERVGEEEANRVSKFASTRGNKLHKICEDYLSNKIVETLSFSEDLRFRKVKEWLDNNIQTVLGLEVPLYSEYLGVAGTTDCIAGLKDGKLCIIDFKTSTKLKETYMIEAYLLQATAYCIMFEERYGLPINRFAILMAIDDGDFQAFYGSRNKYVNRLKECIEEYKYEQKLFSGARGGTYRTQ
jgi:genome maintenance exonuclease 1